MVILHWQLLLKVDVLSVLCKVRFLDFPIFSKNNDFWDFPVGFGVWEGLQSIGNGCGPQMDEFSAHFEPSESICNDFHDSDHFGVVSNGRTMFPEGPRRLRDCPGGPGTPSEGPGAL